MSIDPRIARAFQAQNGFPLERMAEYEALAEVVESDAAKLKHIAFIRPACFRCTAPRTPKS